MHNSNRYYRHCAEECRTIADSMSGIDTRKAMRDVANVYERLAAQTLADENHIENAAKTDTAA